MASPIGDATVYGYCSSTPPSPNMMIMKTQFWSAITFSCLGVFPGRTHRPHPITTAAGFENIHFLLLEKRIRISNAIHVKRPANQPISDNVTNLSSAVHCSSVMSTPHQLDKLKYEHQTKHFDRPWPGSLHSGQNKREAIFIINSSLGLKQVCFRQKLN